MPEKFPIYLVEISMIFFINKLLQKYIKGGKYEQRGKGV
ncbi:unnamed protein product [Fructobacillus fructosus]|uniref:Uncharacterized protein n=1 Tax=Fructobacillus fructosus TaxID=1631 RepID=A0ABN9YV08_9LACO|nr:unnamed protein product [Fructobacillus fructosus]